MSKTHPLGASFNQISSSAPAKARHLTDYINTDSLKENTDWCCVLCVSGYLWYLQVKLQPTLNLLQDKGKLMDFLLRRRDCKMVILSVCSQSKQKTLKSAHQKQNYILYQPHSAQPKVKIKIKWHGWIFTFIL